MATTYDDQDYPILRMRIVGVADDREIRERIAYVDRFLRRGEPVAIIFDSREGGALTAVQRKLWTDWLHQHSAAIQRHCAGCAIVSDSGVARGMFTAIFWLWRPPMPMFMCSTPEEADAWARDRLGAF